MVCTGSAVSASYQQGAKYANGEFIQVHPTSIPGEDKLRLMSESARGEGGRVWVPRKPGISGRHHLYQKATLVFLEEKFPATAISGRATLHARNFQVCIEERRCGENQVI